MTGKTFDNLETPSRLFHHNHYMKERGREGKSCLVVVLFCFQHLWGHPLQQEHYYKRVFVIMPFLFLFYSMEVSIDVAFSFLLRTLIDLVRDSGAWSTTTHFVLSIFMSFLSACSHCTHSLYFLQETVSYRLFVFALCPHQHNALKNMYEMQDRRWPLKVSC